MSSIHAHARATAVVPTTEQFRQYGAVGGGCDGCPFATVEGEANLDDPDEAHFACGLLGKVVWGEDSPCQTADWFDFIVEARDDERRIGQQQLDDATALMTETAELLRGYERHHREQAERLAAQGTGATLSQERDRIEKAERNQLAADRIEAWLRGDTIYPITPGGDYVAHVNYGPANRVTAVREASAGTGLHPEVEDALLCAAGERDATCGLTAADRYRIHFRDEGRRARLDGKTEADCPHTRLLPDQRDQWAGIEPGAEWLAGWREENDGDRSVEACRDRFGNVENFTGAPWRLEGHAELVAFRLTTGDPRFDPAGPVCVNGYLYQPAKEA